MKNFQKLITLHLRPAKKNYYLLEYEIRNYISNGQILRIPAYFNDEKLQLQKSQLNKGLIINHSNSYRLNYYFNNQKIKIEHIINYLQYNNIEVTTKAIKHYLYSNYKQIEYYFTEVEDVEDQIKYNNEFYLDKIGNDIHKLNTPKELIPKNADEESKTNQRLYDEIKQNDIKKLEETDLQYIFENNLYSHKSKYNQFNRVSNVIAYYKEVNKIDYLHYSEFGFHLIDKLIRFAINTGYKKGDKKDYYRVSVIKKLSVFFLEYGKWLSTNGYNIKQDYRDFKLIIGNKKNAHIKYRLSDKQNIVVLNSNEFDSIKDFNFSSVKDTNKRKILEQTRDLFTLQVYLGGLRLSDLKQLKQSNFSTTNGNLSYQLIQQKTSGIIENFVPDSALPLLKKYKYQPPVFNADQLYNRHLKEMAKIIKLNRLITLYEDFAHLEKPKPIQVTLDSVFSSKLARKALVSILYNTHTKDGQKKYNLKDIAMITGHTSEAIKYYLRVSDEIKINMMKDL